MKKLLKIFMAAAFVAIAASCGKDNYDEPKSTLTGKILYNGQQVGVKGTGQAVQLQLYQDGYALNGNIPVYVTQDGSFSAKLFNGEYKLVTRSGNGPWVNTRDTVRFTVNGSTDISLEVTPYFTISGEDISLAGNTVRASFNITKVVSSAKISQVMLLVSKTSFVDDVCYVARENIESTDAATGSVDMSLVLNASNQGEKALFARVGVRADGADQAIYSGVFRLK